MFLGACTDYTFLSSILLIKEILEFICLIVPIILILFAGVDIAKIVYGNITTSKKKINTIIKRFIAAAVIFFIPSLVSLFTNMLDITNVFDTDCWKNANVDSINVYRAKKEAEDQAQKDKDRKEQKEAERIRADIEKAREEARQKNYKLYLEEMKKRGASGNFDGTIVYYCQGDYPNVPYGSYGSIASHGCGPTSTAIIASSFLGKEGNDPETVTNWVCAHGGCTSGGSYYAPLIQYMTEKGLKASEAFTLDESTSGKLNSALEAGNSIAIILVHEIGNCPFTNGGHYLTITGIENGEYKVADPASRARSYGQEPNKTQTWPLSSFMACGSRQTYIISNS